jgi:hypothetical protein
MSQHSDTPTPETDKLDCDMVTLSSNVQQDYRFMMRHARRLERERNEARKEAEKWRDDQRRSYLAAGGCWDTEAHTFPWEIAATKEGKG